MKIIWVNHYTDIPAKVRKKNNINYTIKGFSDYDNGRIYAIRGKSTQSDVLHEKYHQIKKHVSHPKTAKLFVDSELNASMYAYRRTKHPVHMLCTLTAIYNDIVKNEYKVGNKEALSLIRNGLIKSKAPKSWKQDYVKLRDRANKVNG